MFAYSHDQTRKEILPPAEELAEGGHASLHELAMGLASGALTRRKALGLAGAGLLGGAFSLLASPYGAEAHPLRKQTRGFFNPDTVRIPAPPTFGPEKASLYPSPIGVRGFRGPIVDVNVTLHGLEHEFSKDVDVLVVGPRGQKVILMADAGSESVDVNRLTFDHESTISLPQDGFINDLTDANNNVRCQPTNHFDGMEPPPRDDFPSPAPPGPYGSALSVFYGTDPNGTWNLYVHDDGVFNRGLLRGGWSLAIRADV